MDKLREECGVFGIFNHEDAARLTYLGLYALQHRGQESAGIVSSDGERLHAVRGMGYVSEIFTHEQLAHLPGRAAIGHVRYSTAGSVSLREAQPFLVDGHRGQIALCHNGNLPYASHVRAELEVDGAIFSSTSDTEVVLHKIARSRATDLIGAIAETFTEVEGAYSMLFQTKGSLIAVRDPRGFRPLCLGQLGDSYVVASETCAFDLIDATYLRDVQPGEILIIDGQGLHSSFPWKKEKAAHCIFEHVYFSRPDSIIFGRSVNKSRHKMGQALAREHPADADIVVPVPDSGTSAAIGYASESGLKFRFGLVRNHYVGRTFIEPKQSIRHFGVKIKLNPVRDLIEGLRVVLIDDSIVRGTTSKKIVQMVRQAGAREVHVRISCPPTVAPCFYGVDTPTKEELIGANLSTEEIARFIGADSLGYLSLGGLLSSCGDRFGNRHCTACYTNDYPIPVISGARTKAEREEGALTHDSVWPRF
ncbi:MAG TPA: amidophosphoribosyltransferase [Blastocatellia bacterium]|jgi:amidophosphoribosyltransferase|nr:amidophosphoribosyltransferase [Blastocatellia bacterium]